MKFIPHIRSENPPMKSSDLTAYYFQGRSKSKTSLLTSEDSREDKWSHIQDGFQYISRQLALYTYVRYEEHKKNGMRQEIAWNQVAVGLTKVNIWGKYLNYLFNLGSSRPYPHFSFPELYQKSIGRTRQYHQISSW